jgi:predicted MPP superfamily phosphohydrolase
MLIFYAVLFGIPLLGILWWLWADRRLRALPRDRPWRVLLLAFMGAFLFCYGWYAMARWHAWTWQPGSWLMALMMLWALIFLPFLALPSMVGWYVWRTGRWAAKAVARATPPAAAADVDAGQDDALARMTRRQAIAATLVTLPAIATLGTTVISIPQKRSFRIRNIDVPIVGLPRPLDGVTIAHLSDTHVGKFTRGPVLRRLADATNALEADLVFVTGDVIDHSIHDLPDAVDMLSQIDPRDGLYVIEGNHDLFDGREPFVRGIRNAGLNLLLDQAETIIVRGYPVQVMGILWHGRGNSPDPHVDRVAALRDPTAFPVLLAHHPHAFDRAIHHGLPLTLAGHTHGGQLMLPGDIGFGPILYRYWSGLYQKDNCSAVISNGAGNWFPLRSNAPAEVLHLTLRRATA